MARTLDYVSRLVLKEDGTTRDVHEARLEGSSITNFVHLLVKLDTTTANQQVTFPMNFSTATRLFLQGANGTFSYAVNANTRHTTVASGGTAFLHGQKINSLFLSNNSATATPTIEVVLAG